MQGARDRRVTGLADIEQAAAERDHCGFIGEHPMERLDPVREHVPARLDQLAQSVAVEEYPLMPGAVVIAHEAVEKPRHRGVGGDIRQHEAPARTHDPPQVAKQRTLVGEVMHAGEADRHVRRTVGKGQRQQGHSGFLRAGAVVGEIGAGLMPDPPAALGQIPA